MKHEFFLSKRFIGILCILFCANVATNKAEIITQQSSYATTRPADNTYWVFVAHKGTLLKGMTSIPIPTGQLTPLDVQFNQQNQVIITNPKLIWKINRINDKEDAIHSIQGNYIIFEADYKLTLKSGSYYFNYKWLWDTDFKIYTFNYIISSTQKVLYTPLYSNSSNTNKFKAYKTSNIGWPGYADSMRYYPAEIARINSEFTADDLKAMLQINSLRYIDLENAQIPEGENFFQNDSLPFANPNCLVYTPILLNLPKNEILNGICANLELSDRITLDIPEQFIAEKASYTRDAWQDGGWETLMLPFDVSETGLPTGYQFDEFSQIDTNKKVAVFNEVTALQAHTPYLMRYAGNNTSDSQKPATFTATNVTISPLTPGKNEFKGVYQKISGKGKYILGVNKDKKVVFGIGDSTSYINPFRAYIEHTAATASFQMIHQSIETSTLSPNISEPSLRVIYESSQPRLLLGHPQTVRITSAEGRLLYSAYYDKGEHPLPSLSPGLYFVNQTRFIIY